MLIAVMSLSSVRQIFVVLLAVLVTAGLSVSVAHPSNMPMKMSMEPGMTASGHCGSRDCESGGAGKAKAMICAATCAASVLATLPQVSSMAVAEIASTLAPPEDRFLNGRGSPPDPYPPRSVDIG